MLVNLATACKGLMDIEFLSGGLLSKTIIDIAKRSSNLRRLVAHVEVTEDAAHQVLSSCASLEHLEFGVIPKFEWRPDIPVLPNLHILSLKSEARADRWLELSTDTIARHLPALEKLTLSGYRTFREDLSLVPLRILTTDCLFQKYPSTLRQLTHKVAPPFSIVGAHWNLIPHYFPYLTHLHLEKYDHSALILYYQLFEDILDSRVDAVPVGINGNASTPAPVLTKISDYTDIANLRHLSLRHCTFSHEHTHEWDETPMAVLLSTSPRVLTNQLEHL
jgi:F-box/TPR repeat protein Pof3